MTRPPNEYTKKFPEFAKFNDALTLAGELDPDRKFWFDQYRTYITHVTPPEDPNPNNATLCMGFVLELRIRSPNSPMYGGSYDTAMLHLQKLHDEIIEMMPTSEHTTFVMRPYEQGHRRITGVAFQTAVALEATVAEAAQSLVTVAINLPLTNDKTSGTQALVLSDEGFT